MTLQEIHHKLIYTKQHREDLRYGKYIKEKCSHCNGNGYKKGNSTVSVKVPAGIDDGQVISIRGQGQVGGISGRAQDQRQPQKPHHLPRRPARRR